MEGRFVACDFMKCLLTESSSTKVFILSMFLRMKGFRAVMNGSLDLNSTRFASFWTTLVTRFRVFSAIVGGASEEERQ